MAAQGLASLPRQPASASGSIGAEFERLVAAMQARAPGIRELILERVGQRFPGWEARSAFSRIQVAEFIEHSLHSQLRSLAGEELPPGAPQVDAAAARTVARVGELSAFLGGYRAAQAALWETWFCLVEDSGLEGAERRQLLSRGSDFFFRYADLLGDYLTEIYHEARSSLRGDRAQRLFASVKALLEGEQPTSPSGLGVDLHQHHLALIASGECCAEAARALAKDLGRPLFLVAPLEDTCWGWISGSRPIEAPLAAPLGRLRPPAGTRLAIGTEEFGEEGFRTTHHQAQRARLLADPDSALTRYADVAVEALAAENPEEARRFIAGSWAQSTTIRGPRAACARPSPPISPPNSTPPRPPPASACISRPSPTVCALPRSASDRRSGPGGSSSRWPCGCAASSSPRLHRGRHSQNLRVPGALFRHICVAPHLWLPETCGPHKRGSSRGGTGCRAGSWPAGADLPSE